MPERASSTPSTLPIDTALLLPSHCGRQTAPSRLWKGWGKGRDAGVDCLRSGYALPPSAHPGEPSHPDRRAPRRRSWTHPLTGEGIRLRITHARDYLVEGTDHVEVESIHPKRASLPITGTGYRSCFIDWRELRAAGGPVAFIQGWLARETQAKDWKKRDPAAPGRSLRLSRGAERDRHTPKAEGAGTASQTAQPCPRSRMMLSPERRRAQGEAAKPNVCHLFLNRCLAGLPVIRRSGADAIAVPLRLTRLADQRRDFMARWARSA